MIVGTFEPDRNWDFLVYDTEGTTKVNSNDIEHWETCSVDGGEVQFYMNDGTTRVLFDWTLDDMIGHDSDGVLFGLPVPEHGGTFTINFPEDMGAALVAEVLYYVRNDVADSYSKNVYPFGQLMLAVPAVRKLAENLVQYAVSDLLFGDKMDEVDSGEVSARWILELDAESIEAIAEWAEDREDPRD